MESLSFDELLASDPSISAAFGCGRVLEINPEYEKEIPNPEIYVSSFVEKFSKFETEFDSETSRVEFVKEAVDLGVKKLSVRVTVSDEEIQCEVDISKSQIKDFVDAKIEDIHFRIPVINSTALTTVTQAMEAHKLKNLESISSALELEDRVLSLTATLANLKEKTSRYAEKNWNNVARQKCQAEILSVLITEVFLRKKLLQLCDYFICDSVIHDEWTQGGYIRMDEYHSQPENRLNTMLQENAIGFDVQAEYSLNFKQIKWLIQFIFSSDVKDRVEAKIQLLSGVHPHTRLDLIQEPEKVLLASFREYFLTREEILNLCFSQETTRVAPRCIYCRRTVTVQQLRVIHDSCPITRWLTKHFQFEQCESSIATKEYIYVRPSVCKIATSLINAKRKIETATYVGKNASEVVAYKLQNSLPVKIVSAGRKSVLFSNYPKR